jgi:hypothetical protein
MVIDCLQRVDMELTAMLLTPLVHTPMFLQSKMVSAMTI